MKGCRWATASLLPCEAVKEETEILLFSMFSIDFVFINVFKRYIPAWEYLC